jgi:hypothetical protein
MIALRICRAALLASALVPSLAWAGAGTITTKNAAGATITFTTVTDGSTNNLAAGVLCDGVAGANCVTVKAASSAAAQTDLALVTRNPDIVTGLADAACATDNGTCTIGQLVKRTNQNLSTLNTSVSASIPAGANLIGFTTPDPCSQIAKTNVPISQATSTQIIAGTSAKKTYICSINLIVGAAEIVNLIAGTGAVCATGSSAVLGSTTAANGQSLAANGGLTSGNGLGAVAIASAANADNVCLTQNTTSRVSGVITYVQQ